MKLKDSIKEFIWSIDWLGVLVAIAIAALLFLFWQWVFSWFNLFKFW